MLKRNLLANYGGTGLVALMQLVLIPLYVRQLGETQWGVLSVVVALSSSLLVFEAGVSLSVARTFSALSSGQTNALARLRWLERRYFIAVALLGTVALVVAPWLGHAVFPPDAVDPMRLFAMAVTMALAQIVGSLYRSVLVGSGAQVQFNILLVTFTALRHAAALTSAMHGGDVSIVTSVFAGAFVLEALARRLAALEHLKPSQAVFEVTTGKPVVSLGALPLAVAGAVGALGTQIDRLLLARTIDTATLGHYAIAATLSLAVLQLIYPISTALLPRLDRFRAGAERPLMFRRSYEIVVVLLILVWATAVLFAPDVLRIWLGRAPLAAAVAPLFLVHLAGTSLNILCVPMYLGLLAERFDRTILVSNLLALAMQIIVLLVAPIRFGAMAGSLSWLTSNTVVLVLSLAVLRYRTPTQNSAQSLVASSTNFPDDLGRR